MNNIVTVKVFDKSRNDIKFAPGVLESAIKEFMSKGNKFVTDFSQNLSPGMSYTEKNSVGVVKDIKYYNGDLYANVEFLNNERGKLYSDLIEENPNLNFCFSGYGVGEKSNSITYYRINSIKSLDIV